VDIEGEYFFRIGPATWQGSGWDRRPEIGGGRRGDADQRIQPVPAGSMGYREAGTIRRLRDALGEA